MSRRVTAAILFAAVTVPVVLGGGWTAWAAMIVTSKPAVVVAKAAELPGVDAPSISWEAGRPVVSWRAVRTSTGDPADRYVVVRRAGGNDTTICTVGESSRSCRDDGVAAGRTVRYTVRAEEGRNWAGPDSRPSEAVTIPDGEALGSDEVTAPGSDPTPGSEADATPDSDAGTVPDSDAGTVPDSDAAPAEDASEGKPGPAAPSGSAAPQETAPAKETTSAAPAAPENPDEKEEPDPTN